jgi:hypothetical protein
MEAREGTEGRSNALAFDTRRANVGGEPNHKCHQVDCGEDEEGFSYGVYRHHCVMHQTSPALVPWISCTSLESYMFLLGLNGISSPREG